MANSPIPDQSSDFIQSGQRLITDPASDALLEKARVAAKKKEENKGKLAL